MYSTSLVFLTIAANWRMKWLNLSDNERPSRWIQWSRLQSFYVFHHYSNISCWRIEERPEHAFRSPFTNTLFQSIIIHHHYYSSESTSPQNMIRPINVCCLGVLSSFHASSGKFDLNCEISIIPKRFQSHQCGVIYRSWMWEENFNASFDGFINTAKGGTRKTKPQLH